MANSEEISENPKKKCFDAVTEDQKELIIFKKNKENTNKATKLWVNCFSEYLIEKNLPDIDLVPTTDLPAILEDFYAVVCKKPKVTDPDCDSDEDNNYGTESKNPDAAIMPKRKVAKSYKNISMKALRGSLCRYFRDKRSIDIISNEEFIRANSVFSGILQINKEKGLGEINSKMDLTEFDMNILSDYFKAAMAGRPNPKLLQDIVIFYILFYMCRRGRENLRSMTKKTLAIKKDPEDGRLYLYQALDEADKNHTYHDTSRSNDGRMYEITDSTIDPVGLFKFYFGKLNPKNQWLWQKPRKKVREDDPIWYENSPVGPHPLESFMKRLSESAGLSRSYTNHCIRATVITNLDKAGFEARHIKAASGHKSDETIKLYSVRCPESKKREMSDALSESFTKKKIKTTNSTKQLDDSDQFHIINFNDIVDFVPIEKNAEDFDIGNIIEQVTTIKKANIQLNQNVQNSENAVTLVLPNQQVTQTNIQPMPSYAAIPTTNSNTLNVTNSQNFPFLPQMYFPNSNVTINYNIGQPK